MSELESDEASSLARRVAVLEAREAERQLARRRFRRWLVAICMAGLVVAPLALAADGNCPNGYPFCFTANTPALAGEVNHNFAQMKEWLETKVGPVTTPALTVSGATVNGAVSVSGNAAVTGGAQVGGNVSITGTTTIANDLILTGAARLRVRPTAWCDCEYGAETVDRNGNIMSASVPDNFLFENGQAATFQCRGGRFLVGIEKVSGGCLGSVGCLEQYKCCRPCNFVRE